ncbi:MAG: branched-chain amino acid transporter permease [Candidatus Alkaliphilus sp. MAG34]|jgi:branched-subunit amino acid transport protein AzlD
MTLTPVQTFIIVCMLTIGTVTTRFLPFIIFRNSKSNNSYINYLGRVLPYSAVGFLVVYCLKDVNFRVSTYGIPETVAIICITALHYWKENALLSIGVGTGIYMVLLRVMC